MNVVKSLLKTIAKGELPLTDAQAIFFASLTTVAIVTSAALIGHVS